MSLGEKLQVGSEARVRVCLRLEQGHFEVRVKG